MTALAAFGETAMINKRQVTLTALRYSVIVTTCYIVANAYVAPRMKLPGATGMSPTEIVFDVVLALPMSFVFFASVFALLSWIQNRDSSE